MYFHRIVPRTKGWDWPTQPALNWRIKTSCVCLRAYPRTAGVVARYLKLRHGKRGGSLSKRKAPEQKTYCRDEPFIELDSTNSAQPTRAMSRWGRDSARTAGMVATSRRAMDTCAVDCAVLASQRQLRLGRFCSQDPPRLPWRSLRLSGHERDVS